MRQRAGDPAQLRACGWHAQSCNGHDGQALSRAIAAAKAETAQPSLIAMKTVIGFGSSHRAGSYAVHGAPSGTEEAAATKAALGWEGAPFTFPADLATEWRAIGARGASDRAASQARLAARPETEQAEFLRRLSGPLPEGYGATLLQARAQA